MTAKHLTDSQARQALWLLIVAQSFKAETLSATVEQLTFQLRHDGVVQVQEGTRMLEQHPSAVAFAEAYGLSTEGLA